MEGVDEVSGRQWRRREKEGGTFRVPGELLFRTRDEGRCPPLGGLGKGDDGDDGDDGYDERD